MTLGKLQAGGEATA